MTVAAAAVMLLGVVAALQPCATVIPPLGLYQLFSAPVVAPATDQFMIPDTLPTGYALADTVYDSVLEPDPIQRRVFARATRRTTRLLGSASGSPLPDRQRFGGVVRWSTPRAGIPARASVRGDVCAGWQYPDCDLDRRRRWHLRCRRFERQS